MIMPGCTRRLPGSSGFLCHARVSGAATRWRPVCLFPQGDGLFSPRLGKRWQACCILTGRLCQQGIMLIMAPPRHSQLIMSLSPSRSLVMLISPWHSSTCLICMPFLSLPSFFTVSLFFSVSIRVFSRPFSPKNYFPAASLSVSLLLHH